MYKIQYDTVSEKGRTVTRYMPRRRDQWMTERQAKNRRQQILREWRNVNIMIVDHQYQPVEEYGVLRQTLEYGMIRNTDRGFQIELIPQEGPKVIYPAEDIHLRTMYWVDQYVLKARGMLYAIDNAKSACIMEYTPGKPARVVMRFGEEIEPSKGESIRGFLVDGEPTSSPSEGITPVTPDAGDTK